MFSVQTDSRAHHITVTEQWVSGGEALQALKGSGCQASKQANEKQLCDSKGGPRVERKKVVWRACLSLECERI